MDPAARAARVRQRDRRRAPPFALDRVLASDHGIERPGSEKAIDREPPDGHDERRPNDAELVVQPAGAPRTLGRRGHAVASAGGMRTRITAGDRGDVDQVASRWLVEAGALEPAKERAPRAAGERLPARGLRLTRRLADEHGARCARAGDDRDDRRLVAAAAARGEARAVRVQRIGERRKRWGADAGHPLQYPAGRPACPAPVNRYGGRRMPRSVTNAVTSVAGVTSKAGL